MAPHARERVRGVRVEQLEARRLLAITVASPLADVVAEVGAAPQVISAAGLFSVSGVDVQGTVVRMATQGGSQASHRDLYIELFDNAIAGRSAAPVSTANFLGYVTSGRYDGSFFHRATDFAGDRGPARFLQGGGFNVVEAASGPVVGEISTDPPIQLEWAADRPNGAGTIAYARTSAVNSATSGFFFNVSANPTFDQTGNQYAVFGRVLGDGQAILDEFAALPRVNANGPQGGPFGTLPIVENGAQSIFDQLVIVRSASVVAAPQAAVGLRVATSDPAVVSARVNADGGIVLTYGSQAGEAVVTVTGTDLSGDAAQATFTVRLADPQPEPQPDPQPEPDPDPVVVPGIVLGGSGPTSLVATDVDGTISTFTWRGPGTATFRFATAADVVVSGRRATLPVAAALSSIVLDATTPLSSLSAASRGGDGFVDVGRLEATGAVGRLNLPLVRVGETLQLGGGVTTIVVAGLTGTATVGGARVATANVGDVIDAQVSLPTVTNLRARNIRDASVALTSNGTITAAALDRSTLSIAGNPRRVAFASLADAAVRGPGAIGTLAVGGAVERSRIDVATRVNAIRVGSLVDSTVAVGLAEGLDFATQPGDLNPGSRLGTLAVTSRSPDAFARSRVTAASIGSAQLGALTADPGLISSVFARSATVIAGRGPTRPFVLRQVERVADPGTVLVASGLDSGRLSIVAGA